MDTQKEKGINHSVRRLNQHFLTDDKVLDNFVLNSNIENDDIVLEVGAGKGDLTKRLAEIARKVIAIEYDRTLMPYLDEIRTRYTNVEILYRNVLETKLPQVDRVVSNIPFNITEPFISSLFSEKFKSATLFVGETFGKQAVSKYPVSRIDLLTRAYFEVEHVGVVPSSCFNPEPATDSFIITLYPLKKHKLKDDLRRYIIRCIWDQKTRPLNDALSAAISQYIYVKGGNNITPSAFLRQIEENYDHSLDVRVDKLTNPDFLDLYESLNKVNLRKVFGGHKPKGGAKNWRIEYEKHI